MLSNHMFKDDFIFISYGEKLRKKSGGCCFDRYADCDIRVCGWDIIRVVLASV